MNLPRLRAHVHRISDSGSTRDHQQLPDELVLDAVLHEEP